MSCSAASDTSWRAENTVGQEWRLTGRRTIETPNAVGASLWAYGLATVGILATTLLFHIARGPLDKDQAPLLYLPLVVACAIRLGFGPGVLAAAGSFFCWNYFFLPPYGSWVVQDPKDWLSLIVYLVVALATARLAAQARSQTQQAQERTAEARALQQASEQIAVEVDTGRILSTLAQKVVSACSASFCAFYSSQAPHEDEPHLIALAPESAETEAGADPDTRNWLRNTCRENAAFGLAGTLQADRARGLPDASGIFLALVASGKCFGAAHIGARADGLPYNRPQERMILALASHAALALARQDLSEEAAQAQALRQSDELKNTLLSLVSHELRTPLASIKASASGLLADKSSWDRATLVEALHAIDEEADRLSNLVGKLLDLSRLDAGAWRPASDWCDLLDIIGTALSRLSEQDSSRIRVGISPEAPLIRADFVQIAQVFTNLLENALKYTVSSSLIAVSAHEQPSFIQIDVADYGPGIPPDKSEAIFERFNRLDCHRRSGLPGSGLGLAICREIVTAHGGRIWQHNAPQGGAVFSFTLPSTQQSAKPGDCRVSEQGIQPETEDENAARLYSCGGR